MLINIDPLLSPDLLHTLRAMGHGDEIAVVDANFPGTSTAKRLIRLDGVSVTRATQAVVSVMPLDEFVDVPVVTMEVVGNPDEVPPAVAELRAVVGDRGQCGTLERFAFYERAKGCFAIVQTGESRLYGNIILKKGVVRS
ncbi:L-fucose mutarotase [Neorhizobium galegae]|uniref:RbsD/FucU family protein n=1 Tax=Rhizobium/Agrobacterium group TaxID=227290 RepID=UPI001AE31AE3|nr:RbsD/FucU domain-containing protein [Neorhizobium galegae]MBP2550732.1 L-fucose mutarotase [Neorhizobium galegae]